MANYLALVTGKIKEVAAVILSSGAGDAGKIPALDATGRLDNSFMPAGLGAETKIILASEALNAGDFVNIYLNAGVINVRKADANSNAKEAHGFVLSAIAAAANATVYYGNINNQQTALTIGVDQYLSAATPGRATSVVPTGTGKIIQQLGVSTSATEMIVEIQPTIELA